MIKINRHWFCSTFFCRFSLVSFFSLSLELELERADTCSIGFGESSSSMQIELSGLIKMWKLPGLPSEYIFFFIFISSAPSISRIRDSPETINCNSFPAPEYGNYATSNAADPVQLHTRHGKKKKTILVLELFSDRSRNDQAERNKSVEQL